MPFLRLYCWIRLVSISEKSVLASCPCAKKRVEVRVKIKITNFCIVFVFLVKLNTKTAPRSRKSISGARLEQQVANTNMWSCLCSSEDKLYNVFL